MRYFCGVAVMACCVLGATSFDPFVEGPYNVRHKTFLGFLNADLDTMIDVWAPDTDVEMTSPILYFAGGLAGLMPGIGYMSLFERVASHGFTVVQPFSSPSGNTYEGVWFDDIMAWVEEHLPSKLEDLGNGPGLTIDFRSAYIMSHSAGGHVAVEYLKHHCGDIKGQILFSPVDGFDPFGLIDLFAITPGEYLNYAVPTLVIMCGLDNKRGSDLLGDLVPACAPDDLSNLRFYDAMPGNSWLINATDFGHGDALEEFFVGSIGATHFCAAADVDADARTEYRRFVSGEVVTFMSFVQGAQDCEIQQYLEDPSVMPVRATVMQKPSVVDDNIVCGEPKCEWQEEPFPHEL